MNGRAYRIVKAKHVDGAMSGAGARLFGGRWNSAGVPVVYAASSVALAQLEMLVHLDREALMASYRVLTLAFDRRWVTKPGPEAFGPGWDAEPAGAASQCVGDRWAAAGKTALLRVPSAVVPTEFNYLLNPRHARFASVQVQETGRCRFDARLR